MDGFFFLCSLPPDSSQNAVVVNGELMGYKESDYGWVGLRKGVRDQRIDIFYIG